MMSWCHTSWHHNSWCHMHDGICNAIILHDIICHDIICHDIICHDVIWKICKTFILITQEVKKFDTNHILFFLDTLYINLLMNSDFGSSFLLVWFRKCASSASNNSHVRRRHENFEDNVKNEDDDEFFSSFSYSSLWFFQFYKVTKSQRAFLENFNILISFIFIW